MDYAQKMTRSKRNQFILGMVNLMILLLGAFVFFMVAFGQKPVDAFYQVFVSVLKLDSVCLLDDLHCSQNYRSAHPGTRTWTLVLAVCWYVVTYGTVGHFM